MRLMGELEELLVQLIDRINGYHFGKYQGIVSDNQDPENRGRLQARVPRLHGLQTGWALPCVAYGGSAGQGLFAVPDKDASVWIEFEGGDVDYPIWSGTWWGEGEVPESATPDQKVLETRSGHRIVLDDQAGSVVVTDSNQNTVTLDGDGIKLEDLNGNSVTMDSGGITVSGATIKLGGSASDNLVAFSMLNAALTQFATVVQSHTHVGNLGAPTGPPVPPPTLTLDAAKSHHQLEL